MTQDIEEKSVNNNKQNKFSFWKYFFKPFIYVFVLTIFLQIVFTLSRTYDKMWNEEGIPYNVKLEWILDNKIRSLRYNSFIAKSDGYFSSLLQKIHLLVYESAKKKIPDNDPFWIEFWQPALNISVFNINKIKFSNEISKEIQDNLQLVSSSQSKVESFNYYYRYLFVSMIYFMILENIEYKDIKSCSDFEVDVLNTSKPIIEDFFNSKFDFYQYKNDISYRDVQHVPFDFISELINIYMDLIMTEKKETCNVTLKELILDRSADYIYKDTNLEPLRKKISKAFNVYNRQYEEYCKSNN